MNSLNIDVLMFSPPKTKGIIGKVVALQRKIYQNLANKTRDHLQKALKNAYQKGDLNHLKKKYVAQKKKT